MHRNGAGASQNTPQGKRNAQPKQGGAHLSLIHILLTGPELTEVYLNEMRRDFPAGELKPLSMILTSEAEGTAHTWGVFDGCLLYTSPPRFERPQHHPDAPGYDRYRRARRV